MLLRVSTDDRVLTLRLRGWAAMFAGHSQRVIDAIYSDDEAEVSHYWKWSSR